MTSTSKKAPESNRRSESRKMYLSQSDVPGYSLREALRIPQALADSFGKAATKPLLVARAADLSPTSGKFRMLCGASIGYGLTDGGYNANSISLTSLGMRAVVPQEEGDDLVAMREAFLRPRVVNEFLTKYQNSKLPSEQIARNVLESMGVPTQASARALDVIRTGAEELGFLQDIKGQIYVDIESPDSSSANDSPVNDPLQLTSTYARAAQAPGPVRSPAPSLPVNQAGYRTFAIPLTGGRTGGIQLPQSIDRSDLLRIKKWFDVMEDVLIEPDPTDPQGTTASNPEVAPPLSPQVRTDSEA